MRIEKQKFSVQEIVKEKGLKPLQHDNRGVRLEEKDGLYTIYTSQKGRDWNPLKGYFDKRLLVKKLEKQIDDVLGKEGEGKKLTKAVGAYSRSFMTKWLPKINMEQIEQLKSMVDTKAALAGFEKIGTDARPIFSKRFILNQDQCEAVEADLRSTFAERCQNTIDRKLDCDPQHKIDRNRSDIILAKSRTNLRNFDSHKEQMNALEFLTGSKETARDITVFLVQDAAGSVNVVVSQQEQFDVQDDDKNNKLKCHVDLGEDDLVINYSSDRSIASFGDGAGTHIYMRDDGSSFYGADLTIKIPKVDVEARRFDRLKVVQASISYRMGPKTGYTEPTPVEFI